MIITATLIDLIRREFALDWYGIHGLPHWERVRENGLRLAQTTGANSTTIELFAFLHDSKRLNDSSDPKHGARAAEFITTLRDKFTLLTDKEFQLLQYACAYHTDGLTDGDVTVQTCWDADRLDLGRVGIKPDPEQLCTASAKDPIMIKWALLRSQRWRAAWSANFSKPGLACASHD